VNKINSKVPAHRNNNNNSVYNNLSLIFAQGRAFCVLKICYWSVTNVGLSVQHPVESKQSSGMPPVATAWSRHALQWTSVLRRVPAHRTGTSRNSAKSRYG